MPFKPLLPGLYTLALGPVNVFLIDDGELTLIDTGMVGSGPKILAALQALGKQPTDLRRIIVTHCHPDHAGGLAEVKQATGAPAAMHALDIGDVQAGRPGPQLKPAPDLMRKVLFRLLIANTPGNYPPATVEQTITDGEIVPIGGGLQAIHVPGHCAGQLALLWPSRGVLFAADACSNLPTLGLSLGYVDLPTGLRSLAKLAALDFEIAVFGHGGALTKNAAQKFRQKWS